MGHSHNTHYPKLMGFLREYAKQRSLDFDVYSEYHMRLMDGGIVCLDIWTTAKYYFVETNYNVYQAHFIERGGENGNVPTKKKELYGWLDRAFYPLDTL